MSDADPAPQFRATPATPATPIEQDAAAAHSVGAIDLPAIERDLLDVELALARLDSGAYWTDEVTGEPLPISLLTEHPTARRARVDGESPPSDG